MLMRAHAKIQECLVLHYVNWSLSSICMQNGPVLPNGTAKGMAAKPFNPNPCFVPNGYPSTAYYYGGKVSF